MYDDRAYMKIDRVRQLISAYFSSLDPVTIFKLRATERLSRSRERPSKVSEDQNRLRQGWYPMTVSCSRS